MRLLTFLLILVCTGCVSAKPKEKAKHKKMALVDELVAYWDFEQDPSLFPPIWDQTRYGNHLIPLNFDVDVPGLTTGRVGNGLLLNGANQFLSLASNYANISHEGNPFEFFFWYKPITISDGASIVSGPEWSVTMLEIAPDTFFSVDIDGKTLPIINVPLIAGEWYLVRLGFTAGDSGPSYVWAQVNNAPAIISIRASITQTLGTFLIGGNGSNGILDEAGMLRREMSDNEHETIYNEGDGMEFDELDTVPCAKKITCCDP